MDLYFFPDLIHDFFVDFNFGTLFLFLLFIVIYIVISWLLSDMNHLLYGKKNVIAWIPVANVYLLGELILSKSVGYGLSGGLVLIILFNIFIDSNILITILSIIYFLLLLGSIGYALYKYIDLKKSAKNSSMVTNTLNLTDDNDSLAPTKTNGPSESLINSINVVPTNNISNINSVGITPVNSFSNDNSINKNMDQLPINNINLVGNNNMISQTENTVIKQPEEKHYEMPKLILEASNSSNTDVKINNNKLENEEERMTFVTGNDENEKLSSEGNMKFVTGNDDANMSFVTGESNDNNSPNVLNSPVINSNLTPISNEVTVVNGMVSSSNEIKNEESEKMNIINGTIIPNQNTNNQTSNSDSILDLNKKL